MYHLQVVTPEEIIFDDMVSALIAPGAMGYLGVLTDHTPLITLLKPGVFIITDKEKKKFYFHVSKGFLEVSHNEATVLVEEIHVIEEVDLLK